MKLPLFLILAGVLASGGSVLACSEPDVASFSGAGAQKGADGDDDDGETSKKKASSGDLGDDDDAKDKGTTKPEKTDTGGTTPSTPAKEPTPAECFTRCVAPIPEAAALDECSNKCADGDAECLGNCYESSSCGANELCDKAIDQCGQKCPNAT